MHVPYNYLQQEFSETEKIFSDWRKLIASAEFTLGPFLEAFEEKFAVAVGSKNCIAVNNGTDALILSLKAAGMGPGDEIITVANTFYASVGAIVAVGATPVLVDCDDRYQIDPSAVVDAITPQTKAIMPVHWGGASPEMDKIIEIGRKYNLMVIEDACMGIGGVVNGRSPGTFGIVNAYSMHPLKSLNAMGDGGMVATDDDNLAVWMRKYRNHGMVDRNHIEFWGVNLRMQPLQCVVLSHGLDRLQDTILKRNRNAEILDAGLRQVQEVKVPERLGGYTETFALYMVLCNRRDSLIDFLHKNQIEAKIHYPVALHQQEAAKKNCKFDPSKLDVATYQANHLITLPVHQFLDESQMNYMVQKIKDFYEHS
jgi:dTDP-3-amino-2,3,6-trideoxy-4-keto-D-glucose/dTDP-3-amino-3,4,6-trideoxy-alpha-D-glucose/dTDP-2,6-dideoxy-D-kanosamine transaminase